MQQLKGATSTILCRRMEALGLVKLKLGVQDVGQSIKYETESWCEQVNMVARIC